MARRQRQPVTSPLRDPTSDYARRVVSGEIVAGKFVRLACQRHLDDLETGAARGLYFDREIAELALEFFPAMFTVTAGAKAGEPFHLLDWMTFVVGSLFGWRDRNGLRRFRHAWLETGKGQAKSPLMGAIGIYMTCFNGVRRAEAYAIANDKDQAKILFSDAVALCRSPIPGMGETTLEALHNDGDPNGVIIRGVGDNAWKIEHPATGSKFLPVASSDAISGPKPVAVFGDEIHEMKTDRAIQLWKAAIDKMPGDPLMILGTNTPASDQTVGTEYSLLYQRILEGLHQDDSAFAYIARVDEDDDPFEDETCWIKALPAIGVTYPVENVRKRVQSARHMPSERLATERLFFGIPVGSSGFWIDEASWRAVQGEVDESKLKGLPCFLGMDLSSKNDLTAVSACWAHPDGKLSVKTWYWTTAQRLPVREAEDHVPYSAYAAEGHISIQSGSVIDYTFVAAEIARLASSHKVDSLTVDPSKLSDFMGACEQIGLQVWQYDGPDKSSGHGLKIVKHAQGTRVMFNDRQLCMPHSITRLTDKVLKGEITIAANKMTDVCAANAVLIMDGMGNKAFDKQRQRGRIDGMVSMAMAVGASADVKPARRSYMSAGVMFT